MCACDLASSSLVIEELCVVCLLCESEIYRGCIYSVHVMGVLCVWDGVGEGVGGLRQIQSSRLFCLMGVHSGYVEYFCQFCITRTNDACC